MAVNRGKKYDSCFAGHPASSQDIKSEQLCTPVVAKEGGIIGSVSE